MTISDDAPGTQPALVDARELDAAYALLRDAKETLDLLMAAGALLERNTEVMLVHLREAQFLLGPADTLSLTQWRQRRDNFLKIRLPPRDGSRTGSEQTPNPAP